MAQHKLIYIAGPYTSSDSKQKRANIDAAINAAVWCARSGIYYFCPHMNSAYFDDLAPDVPAAFFYNMDIVILAKCDVMLLLPGWEQSEGATNEYHYFARANKPIFYWPNEQELLLKWYN